MVQPHCAIPSKGILNQSIGVLAMSLCQTLVLLSQIYTVTLNPCRNPCLIVTRCCAIRKVDLIGKLMVLALYTYHIKEVNISRCCTYKTVNDSVTCKHLVDEQWVHGRDITMYGIVVHTVSISIVLIATGRTYHIIEHPCRLIVSLNCWLHIEHAAQHVTQVTIQTLYVLIGIRYGQVVLI